MDSHYIMEQSKHIRDALKKGRFDNALDSLDKFIEEIGDKDLDKKFISMSARYSSEVKDKLKGLKDTNEEQNRIIDAIVELLTETKEVAIDKVALKTTSEMEKLGVKGQKTLEYLNEVIILLAESRLFELDVMQPSFRMMLSEEQNKIVSGHRQRFKDLLVEVKK